jgi:hypothetical protein
MRIVFEYANPKATGRDAAQAFAGTFDHPRVVVWHVDGKFHLEHGVKTYRIEPMPNGWRILASA